MQSDLCQMLCVQMLTATHESTKKAHGFMLNMRERLRADVPVKHTYLERESFVNTHINGCFARAGLFLLVQG